MRKELCFAVALLCVLGATSSGIAEESLGARTASGLTVYLGVLPAAMIQGTTQEHAEVAHGDVPRGPHAYHVVTAVFDAESGKRIEDAAIEARVTPLGLVPVTRRLDRMIIAGTVTYGGFFTMRGDVPHRIAFAVTTPRRPEPVVVEFRYEHRTR